MPHRVPCGRESPGVLGAPVSTALGRRAGRRASHPRASRPAPSLRPSRGVPAAPEQAPSTSEGGVTHSLPYLSEVSGQPEEVLGG